MKSLQRKIELMNGDGNLRKIRARPARGLHVVPSSMNSPNMKYHGSTKDIRGRTELFQEAGVEVDDFFTPRGDKRLLQWMEYFHRQIRPLTHYEFILVDIPGTYPETFRYLRRLLPRTKLFFRSHNAEFFHRLDWMKTEKSWRKKWKFLRQAFMGLYGDWQLTRLCDAILPITESDTREYWGRLAGKKHAHKIRTVPYFLPLSFCPTELPEVMQKERVCVAIGTISKDGLKSPLISPLVKSQYLEFSDWVERVDRKTAEKWRFLITGDVMPDLPLSSRIELTGPLPSPFQVLEKASVVCLLSEKGRGFKTKILDSLIAGCTLIVPPGLYSRLPTSVQKGCVVFDPKRRGQKVSQVLEEASSRPRVSGVNSELKALARAQLWAALPESFS